MVGVAWRCPALLGFVALSLGTSSCRGPEYDDLCGVPIEKGATFEVEVGQAEPTFAEQTCGLDFDFGPGDKFDVRAGDLLQDGTCRVRRAHLAAQLGDIEVRNDLEPIISANILIIAVSVRAGENCSGNWYTGVSRESSDETTFPMRVGIGRLFFATTAWSDCGIDAPATQVVCKDVYHATLRRLDE